jgi:ABC-type glycerol-3-phosphate transport system substrate-binding protein
MEHLAEFERLHNGQIRVHTELKARYGRGGLLDLMRNAQNVAPGILPDIVTLDVIELEQAQAAGLLQPLGAALPEATLTGLYPFARSAGEFQGQLWAVQYLADFEHVVYRAEAFQAVPQTWNDLLGPETTPFLFTLGAPQASATTSRFKGLQYTVLSQYLSAGPTVDAANRLPALEEGPLLRLLEFYKAAADAGLLPPNALEVGDVDTIWDIFLQGRVPMVQVSARQYLTGREMLTSARYAATPGWSGPATPIAGGWALAVVTTDATRQRAAFELMAHLLQPENAGPFAASIGWLPTSAAALQTWGSAPYYEFVDAELASAASYPAGSAFSQTAARLQGAITAVLSEGVSPQDAVLAALAQPR